MAKNKRSIKRIYHLEDSPFYEETLKSQLKEKLSTVEYDSKEDVYISKKILYKAEEYVKCILHKEINITEYYRLSKLASTILYYIISTKLEYNSPTFRLTVDEILKILNLKNHSKVFKALRELISNNYIARTSTKQLYWINHNKYYKGTYITIKEIIQK